MDIGPPRRRYFPEPHLSTLVRKFDIPAELQDEFANRLEEAGRVWDYTKDWEPEEATKRLNQRKADWKKLVKLSRALDDFLSNASWSIKDGLWHEEAFNDTQALRETGDYTERGLPIQRVEVVGQGEVTFVPNADDIVRCVGVLRKMAESQHDKIKGVKSKKHIDFALERWVSHAADIWIDLLGRKFSLEKTSASEPLTQAGLFVLEGYQILSPTTTARTVTNYMKSEIKRRNKFKV